MVALVSTAPQAPDNAIQVLVDRTLRLRRRQTILRVVLGFGFPIVILLLWEFLAARGLIDRRFFPQPTRIASGMANLLTNSEDRLALLMNVVATLRRIVLGFGIGASAGVLVGILMALYAPLRFAIGPVVYGTFPMPKIAILPLMIVIFGLGNASTTALVALGVFYMTCINTVSGVLYTNPIYQDVMRAFRMPTLVCWTRVIVPSAMPAILTGLRLGLGQALILVVSAEFVSSDDGIGRFIWDSWQVLDLTRMFMGLAIVLVIGGLAALLGNVLERILIPWASH